MAGCDLCASTGECPQCHGTGMYRHEPWSETEHCPVCGGQQVCPNCDGTGAEAA